MPLYRMEKEQVLERFGTNPQSGLSQARIVENREAYGENRLKEKPSVPLIRRFFAQFRDVMIIILLAAAGISFAAAYVGGETGEYLEPVLILAIVVLNAAIGVAQENKAEKALNALKQLSAPKARVVREGEEQVIPAQQLVCGDLIKMEAGDFVPGDCRLLQCAAFKVDESALTGESVPVEKDSEAKVQENAPLGDRHTMAYAGCLATYGTALAVVTAVGMNTELGKIAGMMEETEGETPLQHRLKTLGKYLGAAAVGLCAIIFVIGFVNGIPLLEIFMTAVSLAVSAIPEGLPAIVTVVLSLGVQRMAQRKAVVRRLPAVETLGSASVICTDKTGTLTQNRMTVTEVYTADGRRETIGNLSPEGKKLLLFGTLCSDGMIRVEGGKVEHIGNPTETAIVYAAYEEGIQKEEAERRYPRAGVLPFDSDRKRMSVLCQAGGSYYVIVKGAFDSVERLCVQGDTRQGAAVNEDMANHALRVIAVAYKELPAPPQALQGEEMEQNLIFAGLIGMMDPPRVEAKKAVACCRRAGIRPVMITGDHVVTASAIARELGILQQGEEAVNGGTLQTMDEEELVRNVQHISVYARVSPADKIRVVKAWQKRGEIVAMTGDGVNDAPALKAADIGCAMGITGTDAAKEAADITLTDDNFATIVEAVREGRGIYANIRKVIAFLLGTNSSEVLAVLLSMVFWRLSPLISIQLLWINLVTDSLPAIALGVEKTDEDSMTKPPRRKNEGIFAGGLLRQVLLQGAMFCAVTLAAFWWGCRRGGTVEDGRTMAFLVLSLSQIMYSFPMRSGKPLIAIGVFQNKRLNAAAAISIGLTLLAALTPLRAAFEMTVLPAGLYVAAAALSLLPVAVIEWGKSAGKLRFLQE